MADRHARSADTDLGANWGWVIFANVLLGNQSGTDLVDHRHHEDRPRRTQPAWPGNGIQRSCRLRRGRGHRCGRRLPRRPLRVAPGTVSARAVLCGHGTGFVRSSRPRNPRPCSTGSRPAQPGNGRPTSTRAESRRSSPTPASRARAVRGEPSRDGEQPQRRPRPGACSRSCSPPPDVDRPDRDPGRRLPGRLGRRANGHRAAVRPLGRKHLITIGMLDPGRRAGPGRGRRHLRMWSVAAALLGAGTAMVYPTLLAAIGDVAHPIGAPARSASTASGVTAASPSAPSWPVSLADLWGLHAAVGPRRRHHRRLRDRRRDPHVRDPPASKPTRPRPRLNHPQGGVGFDGWRIRDAPRVWRVPLKTASCRWRRDRPLLGAQSREERRSDCGNKWS